MHGGAVTGNGTPVEKRFSDGLRAAFIVCNCIVFVVCSPPGSRLQCSREVLGNCGMIHVEGPHDDLTHTSQGTAGISGLK